METESNLSFKKSNVQLFTPSTAVKKLPLHILSAGRFVASDGYMTKRDGLDNYLLMSTLSGAGLLTYEGREYRLKGGELAIIDCNVYHYYRTDPQAGEWTFDWMHISGCAAANYYELVKTVRGNEFAFDPFSEDGNIFETLRITPDNGTLTDGLRICRQLQDLFGAMLSDAAGSSENAPDRKNTANLIAAHIRNSFKNDLTLDGLAEKFYVSKYYMIRLFKESTGITPHEYLINCRINYAKILLKETDKTVHSVCYECGFNNLNNFSKIFKSVTGFSPGVYRNTRQNNF